MSSMDLYTSVLNEKLERLDEEAQKVSTDTVVNTLTSCHGKATSLHGDKLGSQPMSEEELRTLEDDCNALESTFYDLLRQLKLFDVQEVLALYKNLVDVLVQRDEDHYKCPSKMMISSTFESCDDLKDDVMKYYHSDYNKNVMESNLIGCHDLPFDDNSRYVDINNALRKTEALFSQASHLREVLVQELAENVRLLKPVEINHNKGKHRRKSVDGSPANDGNSTIRDDSKSPSPSLAPISPSSALQQIKRSISGGVNDDSLKVRTSAIQDLSSQSVVNGRAHATDLLRSFISELRTIGLAVHSVERKLGTIQRDRQSCTSESLYKSNQPTKDMDVLGNDSRVSTSPHVLSRDSSNKIIDFESIGLHLDKLLKKPIGRSAVQLITDTMKKIKGSVNAFDDEWVKSHCSVMDYYHHNWIEMSSLQSKLSEKSIVDDLEKIPVLADLISNPFGSCPLANNDNCDWDWLTALPADLNSTEKICCKMNVNKNDNVGDLTQILSFLEESCSHPFISPMSVMDKKVSMKNCLTPRLMSELASDINMEVSDNMKRLDAPFLLKSGDSSSNPQCLQESPLFKALQPTDRKNIFNTDFDFVKQRQVLFGEHITNLKTGKYFNETVDRALYILGLGLNAVVVDGCTRSVADRLSEERCKISIKAVADGSPNGVSDKHFIADNFHRAKLLFTIIKRLGEKPADIVGDGDMSDVRPARVGPILIVCRANELLDFHDILQQECDKSIGSDSTFRFLPYFGDSMDREILRSYMLPENLYTERSHCHIVLTNYEAFTQDFVHFKKINWYLMVLDMYWGILSNVAYKKVVSEFSTLNCRHRIVSCPSLGNSNRNEKHSTTSGYRQSAHIQTALKPIVKYPDITSTLNFLLPAFANLLDSQEQPYGKVVDDEFVMNVHNRRFCLHLLASMTVAYEECLELLICDQAEDVNSAMYQQNLKLFQDASELMPYYSWDCVSLQVSESGEQCSQEPSLSETQGVPISKKKIVFHFDYYGKYTRHYIDPKIDAELKNVKLESVGNLDPSLRKRSRKRPGIKSGSIGPPPLKESKSSKEGGGTTVAVGEGIIGVGVIKGKRPYNMAKRRAIQQGLLPSKRKKSGSVASVVRDVMNEILIKIVANSNEGPELLDIKVKKEILGDKGSVNVKEEFSAVDIKDEGNDTASTALGKDTIENENGDTSPALVNLKRSFSNDSDSSMQEPGKYNLPNAKKPKLSYYQRKKEAEYEKALATGIYPQKLLKRQPKKSFDTNGVYIPLKLKVTAMKKFCKKDERDRSISCRGNRVQVVVNFPGRHRFLGSFKNLEEAEEAYNAALVQRDVLTTTGTSGLTQLRLVGGQGTDRNHQSLILQQAGYSKKKENDITEELCSSCDLVRKVHDEVLIHAIRDMLHPLLAVSTTPLGAWESELTPVNACSTPPAFAKLDGPNGFVAYVNTRRSCILGKYFVDTILLSQKCGINDPIGVGHGMGGSYRLDESRGLSRNKVTHVDIHLGNDGSIAREHADIRFNETSSHFEICALRSDADVFVQGVRIMDVEQYVVIPHGGVIQLGFRIFRFLYPSNVKSNDIENHTQPHPLQHKKSLLDVLVSTVKLRQKGFGTEGYAEACASNYYPGHPMSLAEQKEMQEAYDHNLIATANALPALGNVSDVDECGSED